MKLFGSSDCVQLRAPAVVLFAALLLSAALLLLQVDAQERSADESGITAKVLSLEQLWNQAEVAKDTQSLDHLLADTFLFIDVDGSLLNKAEFLKSVTNRSEHIDSIRSDPCSAAFTGTR